MNGEYGPINLTEDAQIDSKMRDIKLSDKLVELVSEIIQLQKTAERINAESGRAVEYEIIVHVSSNGTPYLTVESSSRRAHSE